MDMIRPTFQTSIASCPKKVSMLGKTLQLVLQLIKDSCCHKNWYRSSHGNSSGNLPQILVLNFCKSRAPWASRTELPPLHEGRQNRCLWTRNSNGKSGTTFVFNFLIWRCPGRAFRIELPHYHPLKVVKMVIYKLGIRMETLAPHLFWIIWNVICQSSWTKLPSSLEGICKLCVYELGIDFWVEWFFCCHFG